MGQKFEYRIAGFYRVEEDGALVLVEPTALLDIVQALEAERDGLEWERDSLLEAVADLERQLADCLEEPPPPPDPEPEPPPPPPPPVDTVGIWLSPDEIMALPTEGAAWEKVLAASGEDVTPDLNLRSPDAVNTVARALVGVRLDDEQTKRSVVDLLKGAQASLSGVSDILALLRNVQGYVIAADLIGLRSLDPAYYSEFASWLEVLRTHRVSGASGGCDSIIGCHEKRPNNFGTHAAASRIAIATFLNDRADLERAANVFRGWLGDRPSYAGFSYGDLSWQADIFNPVGVNPKGASLSGRNIDGVLPDDQRRAPGGFQWPPPKEGYVWEALQGAAVAAQLLSRAGYPAWEWRDRALLRAVTWLHEQANYPASEAGDGFQVHLVNRAYGTDFPAGAEHAAGKGMGFTAWTHGGM